MDGHHLTKLIKSDPTLKKIPVFLFSSLINEQMYQKGLSVGADEQFSKPQIGMLIERLILIIFCLFAVCLLLPATVEYLIFIFIPYLSLFRFI